MAYINGNKPIVTDGLIYALDFGNTRSYTSGSTTATSMAYDRVTTSVSGSPVLTDGLLDFTGTEFIKRDSALSTLSSDGTFTVMVVGKPLQEGTLLHQDSMNIVDNPSSSLFGFGLDSGDFSRTYPGFTSSSLQHITYRYSSGTVDTFINGIPVTASAANSSLTTTAVSNALFLGSGSAGYSGSLAQFYVYNRALSTDEIYQTYLVSAGRNGLPEIPKPYTQDENLYKYLQTTGITDATTISAVNTFISDLKSNGIWDKMTVIYPFLTTATGSQAVNLKDPGVLAVDYSGSYTASSTGPVPATATDYIDLTGIKPTYAYPGINSGSSHFTALSYDPQSQVGFLGGTSLKAAGGDLVISSGSRVYHAFLTTGTSSFTMLDSTVTDVEVLVVAGGGGGGPNGGGGGAGGLIYSSSFNIPSNQPLQIVVGQGGIGGRYSPSTQTTPGENSQFYTLVSFGGGRAGQYWGGSRVGGDGGSGGGGGTSTNVTGILSAGSGTLGQGFEGGVGGLYNGTTVNSIGGGGGGGAGSPGTSGSGYGIPGNGGSGSYYPQFSFVGGSPAGWFAGGGGAGQMHQGAGIPGQGGIGGGGTGTGQSGVANTGGGGGGNQWTSAGGAGGSGIVIVSYDLPATALTGSGTGLYITEDAITGSVNSGFTAGITGSGTIGFLTVSRTGSNSYSLRKNSQQAVINLAASASIGTDFFLGGANLAGGPNLPFPATISYASVGAGLTDSEVSTYYDLVSQFQTSLKRQNTLLDNYSGAAAAYSLRRIGPSGYFGPAIRVRRDSDDALRDIGFTSDGQLDTVGLLDFVGVTGSGFVQTWYDQSGNSHNAAQNTSTSQPVIVISGSVYTDTNRPAVYFNGANLLTTPTVTPNLEYASIYMLARAFSDPDNNYGWWRIGGSPYKIFSGYGSKIGGTFHNKGGSTGQFSGGITQITPGVRRMYTFDANESNIHFYADNVFYRSSGGAGTLGGTTYYQMGSSGYGSSPVAFQENIVYPESKRDTTLSTLNTIITASYTTGSDPDYSAFITATGITEPTQSAALETLVSDLKSYGLWDKMKAVYPMVTDKNNRFSRSEDFSTTWTKVSSSVTVDQTTAPDGTSTADLILEVTSSNPYQTFTVVSNGNSAYNIDGSDNPTLNLERGRTYEFDINASEHPFYIMTGSGAHTVGGQYNDGVSGQGTQVGTLTFAVPEDAPDTLAYVCGVHSLMAGTINVSDNTDQHYLYETINNLVSGNEYVLSIYGKFYNRQWIALETNEGAQAWFDIQNGVTGSFTGSSVSITDAGSGWYRCALFFTGSTDGARNQHIHLANADGDYTYAGSADSGSYLWGAQFENGNLLGPYRKTEGSSFTTGSMLDQMKFNLVNPEDSDAAGRLVPYGTCNFGYDGIKTGAAGTNSFLSTNFTSSTIENTHFSIYRSDEPTLTGGGRTDIGITSGNATAGTDATINTQRTTTSVLGGLTARYQNSQVTVGTKKANMYIISRVPDLTAASGSYSKFYQANTLLDTYNGPLGIQGLTGNRQILIGALDYYGGPTILNNTQAYGTYPFASIGDGLTDYEAKALYWIVQKFQTTLGRQVY